MISLRRLGGRICRNSTAVSRPKGDFANKPFRKPVKPCFAAQLADCSFDEATTKALAFRHFYPRAAQFDPAERQLSILGVRPRQLNWPFASDSAPYFEALVASSWKITATACATSGFNKVSGPSMRTRASCSSR